MRMKRVIGYSIAVTLLLSLFNWVSATEVENSNSTTSASNNVIVVVPGYAGSELTDGYARVWIGTGLICGHIQCNELGYPVYPLYAYNTDNYGAANKYRTLYDNLKTRYENSADVKFFAYDWRKTNTTAGEELKNFVSGYSGKIILVAHSMGGLVASEYLRIVTEAQRMRTTLICLGTPFTGSIKAIQAMETGKIFPGIAGELTSSDVQNMVRNLPATYELLPTTRADKYLQVNGADQANSTAWNILKQRSWARFSSGTGIKPMMSTSVNFHSSLINGSGQHYALSAGKFIFITGIGYTTLQKANYVLNGGGYSLSSYVLTNNGDGTVLASSAQNKLSDNNSHVVRIANSGNHTEMTSHPSALARVYQYVSWALSGTSVAGTGENKETEDFYENEKGWIVGEGIDGRRIRVIVRGTTMPTVVTASGENCTLIGDQLYRGNEKNEAAYAGEVLKVSDGYQFELMNNGYSFAYVSAERGTTEVSHMENGYYMTRQTYVSDGVEEIQLNVGDSSQKTTEMRKKDGAMISASTTADADTLRILNQQ